jgi:16S rRNA (uracil1498-N3)-methyltransferase
LTKEQAHYLSNVMRKKIGDKVSLFNGKDGEWQGEIVELSKRSAVVLLQEKSKIQYKEPELTLCFAPVKHAPLHFLIQKATELGVSVLQPIMTQHTIVQRVATEKLRANAQEAAEQCGRLSIPVVHDPITLAQYLNLRDKTLPVMFCDESGGGRHAVKVLAEQETQRPVSVLIGPEGGFSREEIARLRQEENVLAISLGPRILRADTAALVALTVVQASRGDWDVPPNFVTE